MQNRVSAAIASRNQDVTGVAFLVVYVVLAFLLVYAWNYLSEEANAFVSEAHRLNQQDLSDAALFQAPVSDDTGLSAETVFQANPDSNRLFRHNMACGPRNAARCDGMRTILPQ